MRRIKTGAVAVLFACALSPWNVACFADEAADAKALFDKNYGAAVRGVKGTRSTADDAKLAIVLLEEANKGSGGLAYNVLLLEQAYEFGKLHTDGMRAAADALQYLSQLVPRRQLETQEKLLVLYEIVFRNAAGKSNKDIHKKAGSATTDLIVEIAQAKSKRAEYASAISQLNKAVGIARSVAYSARQDEIRKMLDEMTPLAPVDTKVQIAKRALAKDPADKEAAKSLTELYLKDLDRPLTAKTYAEVTQDAKAVELFTLAGKPVDELNAEEAGRLAKWYDGLAADGTAGAKTNALVRAKLYYARLLNLKANDADAKAGLTKVDAALAALKLDAKKIETLVQSRRDRLAIVVAARPTPPKHVDPPKVDPPKIDPVKPDPVKPKPEPVKPADPPPAPVVEPDQRAVEPEFQEEELDDEYWKKRKSIFDFGM